MMARESFEKSLPRFLSVAPFLCLMEDHLEWPDMDCLRQIGLGDGRDALAEARGAARSSPVSSGWNVATMIVP